MRNIFKRYWYLIVIVLVIPIILNYILPLSISFVGNVIGGENSTEVWLGFFGSYIGSIIGAVVTFLVLYFTIKSNKEENVKIRLNGELEKKEFICVEYIYSYSFDEIYSILYKWYNSTEILKELRLDLKVVRNRHNKSWCNIRIVSSDNDNFYRQQKKNHDQFIELLDKIDFILSLRSYYVKYPAKGYEDQVKLTSKYPEFKNFDKDRFLEIVFEPYNSIVPETIYIQSIEYLTSLHNKIVNNG